MDALGPILFWILFVVGVFVANFFGNRIAARSEAERFVRQNMAARERSKPADLSRFRRH